MAAAEKPRPHRFAGARVRHLALSARANDLLAIELMLVEPVAAVVLDDVVIDAGKERGQAVIIVLRPVVEGMIVAAGTLQPDAEENLRHGLRSRLRVAKGSVEVGRRVAVGAAACRDELAGELVERLAVGDALPDPVMEHLHAFAVEHLFLVPQQVRPFQRPEVGKLRALQQRVDQAAALVRTRIGEEGACLLGRGQYAQGIQIGAAQEHAVGAQMARAACRRDRSLAKTW